MAIHISEITVAEAAFDPGMKTRLSKNAKKDKNLKQVLRTAFDAAATKKILCKNIKVNDIWCAHLNRLFPEYVTANPIDDCKALKRYQLYKNRYAFHIGYPPLRITKAQDVPTNSGAVEAIGAMMAGLSMRFFGYPVARCVNAFPDLIYQLIQLAY